MFWSKIGYLSISSHEDLYLVEVCNVENLIENHLTHEFNTEMIKTQRCSLNPHQF